QCVVAMALHAQVYSLYSLQDQECVEGGETCPHIAQVLQANLNGEGNVGSSCRWECLKGLPMDQSMIARIRIGEVWEASVAPVEIATIHDHATDRVTVAAEKLGRTVHHNVGSPLKGTAQDGRGRGTVHDQGDTMLLGNRGHFLNRKNIQSGI